MTLHLPGGPPAKKIEVSAEKIGTVSAEKEAAVKDKKKAQANKESPAEMIERGSKMAKRDETVDIW